MPTSRSCTTGMASDTETLRLVRLIRLLNMVMVANIILLSNDIQLNPGPGLTHHREMWSSRLFHLNICIWIFFLSINETWLDESYSDEKVWLPGFSLLRKDRDCHWRGLAVYFAEHLSIRTQKVKYNQDVSSSLTIGYGVPQGSILGPMLCVVYTNDLLQSVLESSIGMYADDTVIYFSNSSAEIIK